MKTMLISEFKARALRMLSEVAKTKERVVVTTRGVPVAEVIPYRGTISSPVPGRLADAFVFEDDIVSPVGETDWDA